MLVIFWGMRAAEKKCPKMSTTKVEHSRDLTLNCPVLVGCQNVAPNISFSNAEILRTVDLLQRQNHQLLSHYVKKLSVCYLAL